MGFLLALGTMPVHAQNNNRVIVVPQVSPGELQNLRNRQQRENFQQRQQLNRELDSLSNRQRQPRVDVPVMKPTCSPQKATLGC